jgi:hypothetical protein
MKSPSRPDSIGRPPTAEDLARLAREGAPAGLCETCRHARVLASRASLFLRCGLAESDPSLPRYPRLPVVACRGYERKE